MGGGGPWWAPAGLGLTKAGQTVDGVVAVEGVEALTAFVAVEGFVHQAEADVNLGRRLVRREAVVDLLV